MRFQILHTFKNIFQVPEIKNKIVRTHFEKKKTKYDGFDRNS